MDSPLKEEKIEIKKGLLEKSSGEEKRLFKSWKGRYFVFCQIRRGDTIWLKLYYYRSFSSYKEGSLPKGMFFNFKICTVCCRYRFVVWNIPSRFLQSKIHQSTSVIARRSQIIIYENNMKDSEIIYLLVYFINT